MKILVIPDIHENLEFLKYIFAVEDTAEFDKVVCLGDFFDPQGVVNPDENRLKQMAGTLVGMKEILGDKFHLLCGNHDLPYYALRPACGDNAGKGVPTALISCRRPTPSWLTGRSSCVSGRSPGWGSPCWRLPNRIYRDG